MKLSLDQGGGLLAATLTLEKGALNLKGLIESGGNMMRAFGIILIVLATGYSAFAGFASVDEAYYVREAMSPAGVHSPLLESFILNPLLTVDHVTPEGFEVYGPPGLGRQLQRMGLDFVEDSPFQDQAKPGFLPLGPVADFASDYLSPEDFSKAIEDLAHDFPELVRTSVFGTSREGRDLQLVRMGATLSPYKVFFGANIHGNEITGREMLGRLIEDLAQSSTRGDTSVVKLLQAVEIYIVPSINPDGMALVRRGNAQNVDLNRNFPDNSRGEPNTTEGREPEVKALMMLFAHTDFQLSVSFHGGAQVVNYPWDNTREDYPYLEWIKDLSRTYVIQSEGYMESAQFPDGTVRGYDWYPTYGNFQDWSSYYHRSHHVTIELSDLKWPRYSDMASYYELNRLSLLSFLESTLSAP